MPAAVLTHAFPPHIRERGLSIAASGAVALDEVHDSTAIAVVQGGAPYLVSVALRGRSVELGCSCPHAAGGACCKHLWATLVVLDRTPAARPLVDALQRATTVHLVALVDPPADSSEANDALDTPIPAPRWPPDPPGVPHWQAVLDRAAWLMRTDADNPLDPGPRRAVRNDWPADRRLVYVIDASPTRPRHLQLEVMTERQARDGSWSAPKRFAYSSEVWTQAPDPRDRAIRRLLIGAAPLPDYGHARTVFTLADHAIGDVLPQVCATGRARLRHAGPPPLTVPVTWDEHAGTAESTLVPWRVSLVVEPASAATADADGSSSAWLLTGALVRGDERRPFTDVRWMHESGLCLLGTQLAPVDVGALWPLVADLLHERALPLGDDLAPVLERLYALPQVPALSLPADVRITESHTPPVPGVRFVPDPEPWSRRYGGPVLGMQLAFRYGDARVDAGDPGTTRFDAATRTLHHRDRDAERAARDRLLAFGGTQAREALSRGRAFLVPREQLRRAVTQLTADGWWIESDGRALRLPGGVQARVRSGTDWFDLEGTVAYGDTHVALADVLEARRRGADVVTLADGAIGLLPDEWLDAWAPVLAGGERTAHGARFRSSQLALLDALLATLPEVDVDATFAQARQALRAFEHIAPADPPLSFAGTLRAYQREGLGWLHFLRTFGFGGCLADDMGLGKTIQVLALLDARRAEGHGPSLVVVPRSLVFNWCAEAARFAPSLRVADWSHAARHDGTFETRDVDVAIVTYGTLRRDAAALAAIAFDYVVLDEAQAIKNRGTATAKACRLLQASHRLALSGTPIENRLDELWSLLDFLNPGMLGPSSRFSASLREMTDERVVDAVLSRALRPVILRRTKAAVAPELPPRIERTLEVELEPKQRAFYDQLHARVRAEVLQQVDAKGIGRAKLHILEGLLRLRQAACHPVLADAKRRALPSAKLDALIPALADVAAEGNKALVFSQFTGFLALVRVALDAEGIVYEYLDGRTKDRQARVERFQGDPACPVFLISLKAGGHGLNLTAADYVYLLDPWWNPAVEAQAIDRAHRIGRARHVIATRLVARGTVEEKILALQASKRALADAILSADRGGLASIGREELELLLG
jgi:superfamily II DNA or RNA helicase